MPCISLGTYLISGFLIDAIEFKCSVLCPSRFFPALVDMQPEGQLVALAVFGARKNRSALLDDVVCGGFLDRHPL